MPKVKDETLPFSEDTKPYPKTSPSKAGPSPKKGTAKKWTKEDKLDLLLAIVEAGLDGRKVDFGALAETRFVGRTKSQVNDQWRQHIYPTLKKCGSVVPIATGNGA